MAFNEKEQNIEFEENEVSNLYNEGTEEEIGEEEMDNETITSSNPNKKRNLMIAGGILALILIFGFLSIPKLIKGKKTDEKTATQVEEKPLTTDQQGTEENNFAFTNPEIIGTDAQQQGGIPCDLANPSNPTNVNNPNCVTAQTGNQDIQAGATSNQPLNTTSDTSGTTGTNSPAPSTSTSYEQPSGNYNSYSQPAPARSPKVEKTLPQAPAAYQSKEIPKPSSALSSYSKGQGNTATGSNTGTAQVTTNGTQGQTQQQADAINSTQQRIRPTNEVKKADNKTTFLLQSGTYIPLAMTTTLNSDNPSFFMGIVRENVYSQNGMHKLLIPMGSKVIGNYQALSSNTATRMFMFVEKIILPNQEVIAFSNVNVVDLMGEIGTRGQLNGRFWQRLGNTTLALTFSAADMAFEYRRIRNAERLADAAADSGNVPSSAWEDLLGAGPSSKVREVMNTLSEAWKAPKNRIKVPVGYRLNVLVLDELILPEYNGR